MELIKTLLKMSYLNIQHILHARAPKEPIACQERQAGASGPGLILACKGIQPRAPKELLRLRCM
jgi:hypothetical protein